MLGVGHIEETDLIYEGIETAIRLPGLYFSVQGRNRPNLRRD